MNMETYQDMAAGEPNEVPEASFATIAEIFGDGVTLRFDGLEAPTAKHYQCNAFVVFRPGDRVRVIKDSGTYVVEYPVGSPRTSFDADTAAHAQHAATADQAKSAETAQSAETAGTVTGTVGNATYASYASCLRSGGNGQPIFLIEQGGAFYIALQSGSAHRLVTS